MKIIQITPGAGGMFCGGCFHDNTLVAALRKLSHDVTMIPLYLPLTLDENDQSAGTPIFFSGINVYLEEKIPIFRRAPDWLRNIFASPILLKLASGSAAKTRPEDLGELTLSMLRGEEGNQARELDELISWLQQNHQPEIISLSNALLLGLARKLKSELGAPIVCTLQGEDSFLDSLPEPHRAMAWKTLSERAAEVDRFIAPSRYFGELMGRRLQIPPEKISVIYNGIELNGFETQNSKPQTQNFVTLGYFARMCREKGVEMIVDVFILLRQRGKIPDLKLKIGGGCGPSDEPIVEALKKKLRAKNLLGDVEFFPNVTRDEKIKFLKSLDIFCTPALYGEAFGLYVIEAMAAGVPVVQPRHGGFPEIIEATGGGIITEPTVNVLADGIESLLLQPEKLSALRLAGEKSVAEKFSADVMAQATAKLFEETARRL